MNRIRGIVLSSLAVVIMAQGAGTARAQDFDASADKATTVWRGKSVAALFWSFTASCEKLADDLARRQCEGVRAGRRDQVAEATFFVEAAPDALRIGEFDAKKKALPVELTGCIACATPADGVYLVGGKGKIEVKGGGVQAPVLASFAVPAASTEALARWHEDVLPRLKVELLFKVPAQGFSWTEGKARGYRLDVIGYRVWDPCNGNVLLASPRSDKQRGDKKLCKGELVAEDTGPKPPREPEPPKEPELPNALDPSQIRNALEPAKFAAGKCFEAYGVPGVANVRITFNNEGAIVALEQKGDFVDTPTGTCIEKAIRAISFPPSKKKKTAIDYPFILR